MRKARRLAPLLVAGVLIAVACIPALAQQAEWKEFRFADHGFAVRAPSAPERQDLPDHTNYLVSLGNDHGFMVGVMQLPAGTTRTADELLEAGLQGSIDAVHGTLISKSKGSLAGYPGLLAEVEGEGYRYQCRLYMANGFVYELLNIVPMGQAFDPNGQKIMDSFRVFAPDAPARKPAPVRGQWREFRYPEHGFSFSSALEPEVKDEKPAGGVDCTYTVNLVGEQRMFALSVFSVSQDNLKTNTSDQILNKMLDAILAKPKTRLISRGWVSQNGVRGLEAEFELEETRHHIRIYVFNGLTYLLQNVTLLGEPMDQDGERIMQSLQMFKASGQ